MNYQKQLEKWERRRAKFKEKIAQGWTCRELAEANNLSVQRVYKIIGAKKKNEPDPGTG